MIHVVESIRLRLRARVALALLASLVISGGAASTASPVSTSPTDTSPCARALTRSAFHSFIASFNRGAFASLDSLFAEEPNFQWFSSPHPGRRLGAEARRRDTLIPYFRRRHAKREEFHLLAFYPSRNASRWSNFWFEANRRAQSFNDGKWRGVIGKGAAVCDHDSPQLIVLSLSGPVSRGR